MYDHLLVYVPTLIYVAAALASALDLWRDIRPLRALALLLAGVGLVGRVFTLLEPGLCPLTAGGSGMVIALLLALYVLISHDRSRDQRARTTLLLGLVVLLDLSWRLFSDPVTPVSPPPRERALGELHGGLVLVAYTCYLIAAIYSLLYLILYRLMKRRRIGFWFNRLPSLQHLESKAARSTFIGMISLTIGLAIGLYSFAVFHGGLPYDNAKFVVAAVVWLLFAVEFVLRRRFDWHGVRIMWLSLFGVAVIAVLSSVGGGHPFWSPP